MNNGMEHIDLQRDAHGQLLLRGADGTLHVGVTPVRAFPLAAPLQGLSLVGSDGYELAWIAHLDTLAEPVRLLPK